VEELEVVYVHNEGFAGAGSHPEGEFGEVALLEIGYINFFFFPIGVEEGIEEVEEFVFIVFEIIQEDFREEEGEKLEVFGGDGLTAVVDFSHIGLDIGVIAKEVIFADEVLFEGEAQNCVDEIRSSFAIYFSGDIPQFILKGFLEGFKILLSEEIEKELIEDEILLQSHCTIFLNSRS